jgi:hypothetical protein
LWQVLVAAGLEASVKSLWSVLRVAARAIVWRSTPDPRLVGLPSLLAWSIGLVALRVALQFAASWPGGGFNPYGLNAAIAWIALEIAVAALFVPPAARTTVLSAMLVLSTVAELVVSGVERGLPLVPALASLNTMWREQVAPASAFVVVSLWWIGAMVAVLRSFAPAPRLRVFGRAAALWGALMIVSAIVPHAPVFVPRDFDIRTANLWESLLARLATPINEAAAGPPQAASFEQSQHALLQAEVARLAPTTNGATSIYALGMAGWADQDVFLKELDGGLAAVGAVLPIRGRTLRLVNHSETLASTPIANQRNFLAAVQAIGAVMNKDDDVLLLLMTSHGQQTGFSLRLPSGIVSELTPQQVAAALDKAGIKNRIVIVSACYAGTFVPLLANDTTIVLTAADATHTSFGCAPERDWTYFGDAFFRQSMRPGRDFQHAFENARTLIQGWELMDQAQPSNPQGSFGPTLVAKLAPFFEANQASGR